MVDRRWHHRWLWGQSSQWSPGGTAPVGVRSNFTFTWRGVIVLCQWCCLLCLLSIQCLRRLVLSDFLFVAEFPRKQEGGTISAGGESKSSLVLSVDDGLCIKVIKVTSVVWVPVNNGPAVIIRKIIWKMVLSDRMLSHRKPVGILLIYYTSAHGSGRRYYILLLKFLSFFFFFHHRISKMALPTGNLFSSQGRI